MPCWHITTSPFLDDEFNLTIGQRFQAHVLEHAYCLYDNSVHTSPTEWAEGFDGPTVFWSPLDCLSLSTAVSTLSLESDSQADLLASARRLWEKC